MKRITLILALVLSFNFINAQTIVSSLSDSTVNESFSLSGASINDAPLKWDIIVVNSHEYDITRLKANLSNFSFDLTVTKITISKFKEKDNSRGIVNTLYFEDEYGAMGYIMIVKNTSNKILYISFNYLESKLKLSDCYLITEF